MIKCNSNALHENILLKNLNEFSTQLRLQSPDAQLQTNEQGETYKTLAIKVLDEEEFDKFCDIMHTYWLETNISKKKL